MRYFLILASIFLGLSQSFAQQQRYILDADTGNEMDDLYAIIRVLVEPDFELVGLTSAQFNNVQIFQDKVWNENPVTEFNSVKISQQLNEQLLKSMGMLNLPHPEGTNRALDGYGYAWGFKEQSPLPTSAASDFIIAEALKHSPENRLNIMVIGASTNISTAIAQRPEIAKNLRIYLLGTHYNPKTKVWNKAEFNIRNDLNAFDLLMNNQDIDLYVMGTGVIRSFVYNKQQTQQRLKKYDNEMAEILINIWDDINAADHRVMWDLGLVAAVIRPELVEVETVAAPPENKRTSVKVYAAYKQEEMQKDFWQALDLYYGKK
ncbi:nucleoside hydrolase [Persicobacter psychrovividus]